MTVVCTVHVVVQFNLRRRKVYSMKDAKANVLMLQAGDLLSEDLQTGRCKCIRWQVIPGCRSMG